VAGVSREIIGRYERNDASPSIEVAKKIAEALEVSLDYLVGEGELSAFDKEVIKRIEDIEKLDPDTRQHLFFLIDNVIQNFKTKQAFK
jgi:transcriptional regulator with XRE-family HTH domain